MFLQCSHLELCGQNITQKLDQGRQNVGHLVSERHGIDGVLSCKWDWGQKNEEQDDVGESGGIDDAMAQLTKPGEK